VKSKCPKADTKGLHHCFFGRKSGRVSFGRIMALVSIGPFASGESLNKRRGPSKDLAHPVDLDRIDTDADNHLEN
jgi:hypothetical protein